MALATVSKALGINDAMISELLVDTGATLTYDTGIDVPGITSLKLEPVYIEKELRGDEQLLDTYQRCEAVDFSFEHAKISLDALEVLSGGTLAAAGTTPNQTQTLTVLGTNVAKYFKLQAKLTYQDFASTGDIQIILYKCKAKFNLEFKTEEYAVISGSGKAIPTTNNGKIFEIVGRETTAALT